MTNWCVYILKCNDGSLYTGITNNLERRLLAHESGKGARYTRGRTPFKLIYQEACQNRSEASKREFVIRTMSREEKLGLGRD
jgi:putative endonuclease